MRCRVQGAPCLPHPPWAGLVLRSRNASSRWRFLRVEMFTFRILLLDFFAFTHSKLLKAFQSHSENH